MKARIPNQGGNSQAAMMKKLQDMQAEMNRTQQEVGRIILRPGFRLAQ